MKKVLIIACDGLSKSGVPNVFVNIIRNMNHKKYSFDVLYFEKNMQFYKEELESLGCKIIFSDIDARKVNKFQKLLAKVKSTKVFKKIFSKNGPYDVVASFKGFESAYAMKAAYKCGIKSRITHLNFIYHPNNNVLVRFLENRERKMIDKYSTYIACDSSKTAQSIPFSSKNVIVRPFYDETFKYNNLERKTDGISLIQIGSYSNNKNQMFSLKILVKILPQYPGSKIHFVGFKNSQDLSYLEELEKYVKAHHLSDSVVFHKFDENTNLLFKQCNYLLFPSYFESFGIVPIEAQAAGLSCFCSNSVTRETDCGGCVYLPIDNPVCWADAILNDYRQTKGEHKKYDLSKFSSTEIINMYELICENKYKL